MNPRHLDRKVLKGHEFEYLAPLDKLPEKAYQFVFTDPGIDKAVIKPARPSLPGHGADLHSAYGVQSAGLGFPDPLVPGEGVLECASAWVGLGL